MAESRIPSTVVRSGDGAWQRLSAPGVSIKVLHADKVAGASIALIRFDAGARTHAASTEVGCLFLVAVPKPIEILKASDQ